MLGKNNITLWEHCRGPQRGGVQRCCSHDHPVTWKQMSHCHYVSGWKHVGVLDSGWRTANTSSFLPFYFLKPKFIFLFGSRSRRGERVSQSISISCPVSSSMSVELNLGWPGNHWGVLLGRDKEGTCVIGWPSATLTHELPYPLTHRERKHPSLQKDKNVLYSKHSTMPPWARARLVIGICLQESK